MHQEAARVQSLGDGRPWRHRVWLPIAGLVVLLFAVLPAPALAATGPHIVRADGDCLRMRATPGLSGTLITCLAEGTQVFALGESQDVDGLRWERVSAGGQTGWVAGIYIVPGTATSTPAPPAVTPAPTVAPPSTTGTISGTVSASGGYSLVLWTGGRIEALVSAAQGQGCSVRSVWVSRNGVLIAYIVGAPAFVNETWTVEMGTGTLPEVPVILVCAAGGATPPGSTPTPAPGPVTPVATPTPPPPTGTGPGSAFPRDVPPGPAGNE